MSTELTTVKGMTDLSQIKPKVDLVTTYWSPETIGECKNCQIINLMQEFSPSYNDPTKQVELKTVIFAALDNGVIKRYKNASRLLVGAVEDGLGSGEIVPLETWVRITYMGERRNKTNSYKSRTFKVEPLDI